MEMFHPGGGDRLDPAADMAAHILGLLCWTALALVLAGAWMAYMMSGILDAESMSMNRAPAIERGAAGKGAVRRASGVRLFAGDAAPRLSVHDKARPGIAMAEMSVQNLPLPAARRRARAAAPINAQRSSG